MLATLLETCPKLVSPPRLLLIKDVAWQWEGEQSNTFNHYKCLLKVMILRYSHINKPVKIQVDVSKSGLGATLFQDSQHIVMASKALNSVQGELRRKYI